MTHGVPAIYRQGGLLDRLLFLAMRRPPDTRQPLPRGPRPARPNFATLMRAVRYVGRHRRLAILAYGSLFIATAAQLIVPQLVRVIIDSVIGGVQVQADRASAIQALVGALVAIILVSGVRALFAFS